jgi:hypothetical protein
LIEQTNLIFTKDGDLGTNGTSYSCKIIAYNDSTRLNEDEPLVVCDMNDIGNYVTNFNKLDVVVYEDGSIVNDDIIKTWSILKHTDLVSKVKDENDNELLSNEYNFSLFSIVNSENQEVKSYETDESIGFLTDESAAQISWLGSKELVQTAYNNHFLGSSKVISINGRNVFDTICPANLIQVKVEIENTVI